MCKDDWEPPADFKPYRTLCFLRPAATAASGSDGDLVIENFPITYEGYTYTHGAIAYVKGRPPAPVVMINPNYAGLKQFDIDQAAFLAKAGYVGLALDLYKDTPEYPFSNRNPEKDDKEAGKAHFKAAFKAMNELLLHPKPWRGLMGAYLAEARKHPAVHQEYAGTIGYCLGGQCVLEQVRSGHQIQAAVTFHGLLQSMPLDLADKGRRYTQERFDAEVQAAPNNYARDCKVLIENGDMDQAVPPESIDAWKQEMDAAGIDWRFNNHARTPHGFALAPGVWSTAYTEAADRRSTLSMLSLFAEVWPEFPQYPQAINACGTRLNQGTLSPASKL